MHSYSRAPELKLSPAWVVAWLCLLLVFSNVGAAQDKAFAWEVEGNDGSKVYLMGSIHFARPDFYPLRRQILDAFEAADNLVVELDLGPDKLADAQRLVLELGTYRSPDTLRDHISEPTYRMLAEYLSAAGLPLAAFEPQKPGLVVVTLTSLELVKLGLSPQHGIDLHFIEKARGNKPILELETVEQQMRLLLEVEDGDAVLRQTLSEFGKYDQMMDRMIAAWRTGDTEALERLIIDEPLRDFPASRPFFERVFNQRNIGMTEKIRSYLDSGDSYFVVVGAGHLIGEEGILALLEEAGFNPKRL